MSTNEPRPLLKKSKVRKSEALWLTSFSDLSILLMCFFVLQLSFSTIDKRKFERLKSGMKAMSTSARPVEDLEMLTRRLEKVIKARKLDQVTEVSYDMNGLSIEFKDATLFEPGSAEPNPENVKVIDAVMSAMAKAPKELKLVIEGHTDDTPMRGGKYASNWDLSAARGVALLERLKTRGVAEDRMSVLAYAHTRPKVDVNGLQGESLQKARAANRRVVIRLE